MPRSRRCRKAGWWPGQHHCRASCGGRRRTASEFVTLLLVFLVSPVFTHAQSLLHIRIIEGEGAIHSPGAKASRGIVVEVTDETGRPVDGAAVSFRMPEEGPGATFERDMRTDIRITGSDGRAATYGFHTTRLSGPFQVRVTAVKNQVRAGTVFSQYVAEKPVKGRESEGVRQSGGRKWLLLVAAGVGAAAAGALLAGSRGGSTGASAPPGSGTPNAPPSIGSPTIIVGGP